MNEFIPSRSSHLLCSLPLKHREPPVFPRLSLFVLLPSSSGELSRETIAAGTPPPRRRPTHPSLHTSNPLAAVHYTNTINTISAAPLLPEATSADVGAFLSVGSGCSFWLQIFWRRLPSSFVISASLSDCLRCSSSQRVM